MHGDDVRGTEKLFLRRQRHAVFGRFLAGEILAPGDHLHPERKTDTCDTGTDPPEPHDAQRLALQTDAKRLLPLTVAHRLGFGHDVARARQDQAPRQLDRRVGIVAGVDDFDASRTSGADVDRCVSRTGRRDQFQGRQASDDFRRQRRAFPHHADDIERRKPRNERVDVGNMIVEEREFGRRGQRRPVGAPGGDVLIVVEYRDLHGSVTGRHLQALFDWDATVLAARVRNSSHCSGPQLCRY